VIQIVFMLAAIFAPWVAPHDPTAQDLINSFQGPSLHHPMGTDRYGSGVSSRVLYGLRFDLMFGIGRTYIPLVIGMLLGAYACELRDLFGIFKAGDREWRT
jgi:ABC-type dipeptide/oligopeptide/nickel transport system permease subunit